LPPRLPALKPKRVVAALERAGFYIHHQRGSHARPLHRTRPELRVTVPIHNKGLPPSFFDASNLEAGKLTEEEFLKLL
jgi:predicted RNA binding protein YcfA (HicA-like mRNA interferase family)